MDQRLAISLWSSSLRAARAQADCVGDRAGVRVFLLLQTDDLWRDCEGMTARGVEWVREPKKAGYGTVAVFRDLCGTLWDLGGVWRWHPSCNHIGILSIDIFNKLHANTTSLRNTPAQSNHSVSGFAHGTS